MYNPDVLSCLANLSNDEVFTPPDLVNAMLDTLPANLWQNKEAKFLDPVCKSGVYLREIAKRLLKGLEKQIPNKEKRIAHIFQNQLYGIAITELTSLMSRRSVYCSKDANGKYSTCKFSDQQGNIRYEKLQHSFQNGKCTCCGANESVYGLEKRDETLETYAYNFIHLISPTGGGKGVEDNKTANKKLNEILNMKFDVIIGNPPYQLADGGGTGSSAMPIYHKFIQQAKKLNPRYLVMIVPSRWFTGGRGLDDFRDEMLHDDRIREIHDFPNSDDCFSGVNIEGGVCFFVWNRDNNGLCKVTTYENNVIISTIERPLLEKECETFIRYNAAISILRKIQIQKEKHFSDLISANDPFGFDIREENSYRRVKPDFKFTSFPNSVILYYFGWQKDGIGHIDKYKIRKNTDLIEKYKVFISKAYGMGAIPTQVINEPLLGEKGTCCTETYLLIGPFESIEMANNVISYIQTRFFRFLVLLIKNTQNAMKKVYSFVPLQDFSEE